VGKRADPGIKMVMMPTEDISPYVNNPKFHPEPQVEQIMASIRQFGFVSPILVDAGGSIIAGHGRLLAASRLGMANVPVIRLGHLTPEQAKALRIADNSIANSGTRWDVDLLEAELASLKRAIDELEVRTLLSGEYDAREALVTVKSEAGGVDAADWAQMVLRMYLRWAERHKYPTEVYDTSYAEEAGIKSTTFAVNAPYAYGTLRGEHGTHRMVRISKYDNQGRRQTSFAGVDVMPVVEQTDHIDIPEDEIRVDVFRSSGPGGQGVNTTDSAVRITHIPTGEVVTCQDERSQLKNKAKAMAVLRARLLAREQERRELETGTARRAQIGRGERSEKMRTYNFPQDRLTDKRLGYNLSNLERRMDGDIDDMIDALAAQDEAERLSSLEDDAD